ncbi:MAG: hypothetical protein QOH05_170 [Acetobacteraceae bacterium]|jgi:hypothetical protein|nr:hypothetical protein [Acetobacteraceae bacterium]
MVRLIIRRDRSISEHVEQSSGRQFPAVGNIVAPRTPELTAEEAYLVGDRRNFVGRRGEPMYVRARANRGSQLRRIGAADHCIVCGMPALPGVTAFAHPHS